ncbi:MAG: SGNH/GDSL hydrolase family protein [Solirubrobacteraceae bacterium]
MPPEPRGRLAGGDTNSWRSPITPSGARRAVPAAFAAALVAVLLAAAGACAADPRSYSALGDSYTAAPFVPSPTGSTLRCQRSTNNYPSILARTLGIATFRDASCSGAVANNMTTPPSSVGGLPSNEVPQFSALDPEVELVTLGIGYNDIGIGPMLNHCLSTGLLAPTGSACREFFAPGGSNSMQRTIDAAAPNIAGAVQGIHERSPLARVIVVGYPGIVPSDGTNCWPLVALSPDDVRYIDSVFVALNAMLTEQAEANDAEFADTYRDALGHDMCQGIGVKWFEGVVPTSLAAPLHPNAQGSQGMAGSVLRVIRQPRPAPVLSALRAVRRTIRRGRKARFTYRLNRAGPVTAQLQRKVGGRRVGKRCRPITASNRTRKPCRRLSAVLRTISADGRKGDNRLALGARGMGKVGEYRLTAWASADERRGDPRTVDFRVRR